MWKENTTLIPRGIPVFCVHYIILKAATLRALEITNMLYYQQKALASKYGCLKVYDEFGPTSNNASDSIELRNYV